ncbi:uncharacterized protein LOC135494082 [Lineus longissimus]|uniref:uncharacterized protein LOC135494082 n=1 Tax=Lineus longissimus TaxID=88925 RepID=UPI00315D90DB
MATLRTNRKVSAIRSFEDTVNVRQQKEETSDLDFLARTENYSGAINQITNFALKVTRRHSDGKHKPTESEVNFEILKNATSISSLDLPLGLDETVAQNARLDYTDSEHCDSGYCDGTPSTSRTRTYDGQRSSVTTPPSTSNEHRVPGRGQPRLGASLKTPKFGTPTRDNKYGSDDTGYCKDNDDDIKSISLSPPGTPRVSLHPYVYTRHYDAFERFKHAKEKFRHSVRLILILLRWVAEITKNSAKHNRFMDQLATFSEMAQEAYNTEELRNSELAFDVSYFKANKDINLSAEVKEILSMPPAARTKDQLQTVLFGLQHLRSFAEYPLHMQEKLCRVAWYERVPARRVIIRQGHTAENFYFILSGKAIVKRAETNPVTGEAIIRTAAVMTKGMSFGELALLHHSRRTATVVSHDTTQLLTIARRDFMDIFMGGTAAGHIPDHIKFVNSLEFMKDWPIENLLEHPEYCLFHFFKRGVVIVRDSRQSDWLYIVKSGACQVMKELKAATPSSPVCKKTKKIDLSLELPRLGTGEQSPRIDDGRKRGVLNSMPHDIKIAMSEYASNIRKSQEKDRDDENTPNSLKGISNILPRISNEDPQTLEGSRKTETRVFSIKVEGLVGEAGSGRPGFSRSKFNCAQSKRPGSYTKANSSSPDIRYETPEIETSNTRSPINLKIEKENTPNSVFVQVQLLKPRDCFGLTSVQFDDDVPVSETSVSLVSKGAECIMLSKQFFMRHANEKVRMELRRQIRPYPTANTFQENLQIKVDWDNYRRELLKDITTQHDVQAIARKTAR